MRILQHRTHTGGRLEKKVDEVEMIKFLTPPEFDDKETTLKTQIFFKLVLFSAIIVTLVNVFELIVLPQNFLRWIFIICSFDFVSLGLLFLNKKGNPRTATYLFAGLLIVLIFGLAWSGGGIRAFSIQEVPVVLGVGLILGWKEGVFTAAGAMAACIGLVVAEYCGFLPVSKVVPTSLSVFANSTMQLGLLVLLQYLIVGNLNKALREAKEEVTRRTKAEETLRESEERMKAIVEGTPHLFFYTQDAQANTTYTSPTVEQITGYKVDTWLKRKDWFVTDAKNSQSAKEKTHAHLQGEVTKDPTFIEVRHANGYPILLEAYEYPIIQNGRVIGLQGVAHDITERKQAEESLQNSEKRFRLILDNMPILLDAFDSEGRFIVWNKACEKTTGYTADEIIGNPDAMELLYPNPEQRAKVWNSSIDPGNKENVYDLVTKKGEQRTIEWFDIYHRLEVPGWASWGMGQDITERKRAEEALRESEERYRALFTFSPHALYVHVDGRVTLVNPAICQLLGAADPSQLIGKSVFEIVHPQYHEKIRERWKLIDTGRPAPLLEEKFIRVDGTIVDVEVSAVAVDWEGSRGVQVIARDITERKRAEEALLFERMLLRTLIDNIPDSIYSKDMSCRKTLANLAEVRNLRVTSEAEVLGKDDFELYPKELAEGFFADDQLVLRTGQPMLNREEYIFDEKGEKRWLLTSKLPLRDKEGRTIGLAGISRDITERKRAEDQLRKLLFAVEQSPASIVMTDTQGNIEYINPKFTQITGYTIEEVVGKNPRILKSGETPPEGYKNLWETIMAGKEWHGEFHNKKKNGEFFWESASISPVKNADNIITNIVAVKEDITERKQAEETKRENDLMLELAMNAANMAWWKMDIPTGNVSFEKRKAEMLGFPPEQFRHYKDFMALVHPEDYDKAMHAMRRHLDGLLDKYEVEYRILTKSGEYKWLYDIGSIIKKDSHGKPLNVAGLVIDITERKHAEEALRHSQKLESIGTLAGGIAHDFNNLLNAILGQSTLAMNKISKESPAKDHIEKSIKAAERAADLTKHLLAYSGKGKFITEEIDLNRLVEENIQMLEVSIPKTVQLLFFLDSSSPHIHGDVGQIQQVIMNLIINAGEAIAPNPGSITVHTGRVELTQDDTEFWKYTNTPLTPGPYALLQVKDTGYGIKPEVLARIFDPFFTTKFTGRGLGLAAVLGIVRGHHGGLRIESEEGQGTKFEIIFPLVEASTTAGEPEMNNASVVNGTGKTVLVIDDEPSILELLKDVFTEANFKVIEAPNPMEGIELYRQHHDAVTMVILDYSMPGMDGKSTFEELVKIKNDVMVVLCSGYTEEEIKSAFGEVHPQSFIQKPYKPSQLLETVSKVMSKGNL